jgi:hypothetical protein
MSEEKLATPHDIDRAKKQIVGCLLAPVTLSLSLSLTHSHTLSLSL